MRFAIAIVSVTILCGAAALAGTGTQVITPNNNIQFVSTPSGSVEVMTFNIRTKTFLDGFNGWGRRKDIVVDLLSNHSAEIVGLQEVRSSQLRHLRKSLPQYGFYAAGRNNGNGRGESCPILYRKDRFLMADSGTFWFSDTPSVPGSKDWGNMPPRICSWARLVDKHTQQGLYVFNLHLDHLSQKSRKKSVQLLTQKVTSRKHKDPFVVMGDFNMKPDNPAMQYMQNLALRNPKNNRLDIWRFIPHRTDAGTRHGFRGKQSGPQIDHISTNQGIRVTFCDIDSHNDDGHYPSDHFPVYAKISIGGRSLFSSRQAESDSTTSEVNTAATSL